MKNPYFARANCRRYALTACLSVIWICLCVLILGYSLNWFCTAKHGSAYRSLAFTSDSHHKLFYEADDIIENKRIANVSMKQVCYYWIPRDGNYGGNLTAKEINPTICTHIIIAGANIENNNIVPIKEEDVQVYSEVVSLKQKNPSLRVLICLGSGFPTLVQDPHAVAVFAFNAQQFLLMHQLDGLDLDWEFPAWPSWQRDWREKKWFTYLVIQLHNALKLASNPPLMLTIAVGAPQNIVDTSYEVKELAKYVDYVSVMGYDYHMFQPYMPFTGHNAPLSKHLNEVGFLSTLNIQWATKYWLKKGMPKEKLVVGIPTYGRTWKLLSRDWYNVGAPAVAKGMMDGEITYIEACIFIKEGATRYFDSYSQVPYCVRDKDWVSYEDPKSITAKAQWIKKMAIAGVMTWNLNSDDWAGLCSGKKYELHSIIKDIIRK